MYIPKLLVPKRWNLVSVSQSHCRRLSLLVSSINYLVGTPKKKWIRKTKQKDAQQHLIFVVVIKSRRHKVRSSLNARRNKKKKIIPKNVQLRERNKIENKEREIHRGLGWDVGARAIHAGNGQMVGHHFFFSTVRETREKWKKLPCVDMKFNNRINHAMVRYMVVVVVVIRFFFFCLFGFLRWRTSFIFW